MKSKGGESLYQSAGSGKGLMVFKTVALLLFAFAFAVGQSYVEQGVCYLNLGILVRFAFFLAIGVAVIRIVPKALVKLQLNLTSIKLARLIGLNGSHVSVSMIGLLLICWLPYFIAFFPGTLSNDTTSQLSAFIGRFVLGDSLGVYDRNPLFDTFVFGSVVYGFGGIFGTLKAGIAVYVSLQLIAFAYSLSNVVRYIKRWGGSDLLCILALCFFAIFPLVPIWACNISKDTFFCVFFIPFLLRYVDLFLSERGEGRSAGWIISFSVLCVLVSLSKKTGMYIVVPSLVLYMIFNRTLIRTLLPPVLATLLVMVALLPGVTKALGVKSGGRQEMLAVPLQQTARCVAEHGDDMTKSEKEAIDALLNLETLGERYTYWNADPVKGFSELGDPEDYSAWFKAWVAMGLRHPLTYFHAFAALESPWVSFTPISALFNSDHHVSSIEKYIPESTYEQPAPLRFLSDQIATAYSALTELPVVGLLFGTGLYAFIIPLSCLVIACERIGAKGFWMYLPFVVTVATLFVSPVAVGQEAARYILGLVLSAPLQIAICARVCSE